MKALQSLALAVSACLLFNSAAIAETITISGDDPHLYLRQRTTQVTSGYVGNGAGGFYQGPVTDVSVFRGALPISDDRFLELLENKGTARDFVLRVRSKKAGHTATLWWTTVGLLAGTTAGSAAVWGRDLGSAVGTTAVNALLVTAGLTGLTTMAFAIFFHPRQFSLDEAADAITEYNTRLDAKPAGR